MKISKSSNVGNTFIGLVCAAFGCECSDVDMDSNLQYGSCGTISVSGKFFDWKDAGNDVIFIEAK